MKVRGKQKDLINFIKIGLQPLYAKLEEDKTDKYLNLYCSDSCYIKGTHRGFVKDFYVNFDTAMPNTVSTIVLSTQFAWDIQTEQLLNICKEYNVDMHIYAYEMGQEFNRHIEIINGEILHDDEIKFKDYVWECTNPTIGG